MAVYVETLVFRSFSDAAISNVKKLTIGRSAPTGPWRDRVAVSEQCLPRAADGAHGILLPCPAGAIDSGLAGSPTTAKLTPPVAGGIPLGRKPLRPCRWLDSSALYALPASRCLDLPSPQAIVTANSTARPCRQDDAATNEPVGLARAGDGDLAGAAQVVVVHDQHNLR